MIGSTISVARIKNSLFVDSEAKGSRKRSKDDNPESIEKAKGKMWRQQNPERIPPKAADKTITASAMKLLNIKCSIRT